MLKAKVLKIDDDAVKTDPVVANLEIGTNIWAPTVFRNQPLVEDTKFINVQVSSDRTRGFRLNTRLMWDAPRQLADLDLFIYDSRGQEIGRSERPLGQPQSTEFVSVPARRCDGFTVEVRALRTLEASGSLEMWLSRGRSK